MDLSESRKTHSEMYMVNKSNVNNTPSIFTIDHILNNAGIKREENIKTHSQRLEYAGLGDREQHDQMYKHRNNLENVIRCPKMLDWLQYSRYKPPRLPRKLQQI